jgi:dTDP-4-dehydrorhamnose reductase
MGIRVLILGHKGMLGHMVLKYLKSNNIITETTDLKWPSNEFKNVVKNFNGDFIINCIGAIHQKTKSFEVNWELPIFLDFYTNCKIIHPGTDCEKDNDLYGVSKKIAKDYINNYSKNTKCITTSIIGPELNTNHSLMNWFLSNSDGVTVNGFSNFYWDGNTTLTWSEICYNLINNWDSYNVDTIISSDCVSKKEILESLNEVFNRKIIINDDSSIKISKCLESKTKTEHIKTQLYKLKLYYYV